MEANTPTTLTARNGFSHWAYVIHPNGVDGYRTSTCTSQGDHLVTLVAPDGWRVGTAGENTWMPPGIRWHWRADEFGVATGANASREETGEYRGCPQVTRRFW